MISTDTATAQPQCLTTADTDCNQAVSVNELIGHINAWYACSACVPDIFNALQAYFDIPFCGDWSCSATAGEDCSTCQHDCGICGSEDLIVYLDFEESSGDYFYDKSDNNYQGEMQNFVCNTMDCNAKSGRTLKGYQGNGIILDGWNDFVKTSQFYLPGNVTLSFWLNKHEEKMHQPVMGIGYTNNPGIWCRNYIYDRGIQCGLHGGSYCILTIPEGIEKDEWHNVVYSYNSSVDGSGNRNIDAKIYLDGDLKGETSCINNYVTGDRVLVVGKRFQDEQSSYLNFDGVFDEVKVFSKKLTDQEVSSEYQSVARSVYDLVTSAVGNGWVDRDPGSYERGETAEIRAVPETNWEFAYWQGDIGNNDPSDDEIEIAMDMDRSITAYFSQKPGKQINSLIGASSPSALPGETVLLTGENLDSGDLYVTDGTNTAIAQIIDNGNVEFRDSQKLMAIIPASLGKGTLELWLEDAATLSNTIKLNEPEPWWVQPDRIDIGDTTRIFGRNLESATANGNVGEAVKIELHSNGGAWSYDGVLIEPNVIRVSFSSQDKNGKALAYGDYKAYIFEPKDNSVLYGGLDLTVRPSYQIPSNTISVTDYGAVPNDGIEDGAAFVNAISALTDLGGGILNIPQGTFDLDYPTLTPIYVREDVHMRGAGKDRTIIINHANFSGFYMESDTSIDGLTIIVLDNYTTRETYMIRSEDNTNTILSNIKMDFDNTSMGAIGQIHYSGSMYSIAENLEFQGNEGAAIWISSGKIICRNNTFHGAMPAEHYDIDYKYGIGSSGYTCKGTCGNLIIEDDTAHSRWETHRGFFKRFLVGNSHFHSYISNNHMYDIIAQAYSGSGEFLSFESPSLLYNGSITINETNPRLIHLTDKDISNYGLYGFDIYGYQEFRPFIVAIKRGKGFGQTRTGKVLEGSKRDVILDEPFLIEPNSTSEIVISFMFSENIIYNNNISIHKDNTGVDTAAIQFYGMTTDNIIENNKIDGAHRPIIIWNFMGNDYDRQVNYFNEISDNEIYNSLTGILTYRAYTKPLTEPVKDLGTAVRNNIIKDSIKNMPIIHNEGPQTALGVTTGYYPWGNDSSGDIILGQIYENNYVEDMISGFEILDSNSAGVNWLVLRNNKFLNATRKSIYLEGNIAAYLENNEVNTLPMINIESSPDHYKCEFRQYHQDRLSSDVDCFVYSEVNSGSFTFAVSDDDGDSIQQIHISAPQGISLSGNNVSWTNLNPGIHEFTIFASDGKGIGERRVYLHVGNYDDFEAVSSITSGPPGKYSVITDTGSYAAENTTTFYHPEPASQYTCSVDVYNPTYDSPVLRIRPTNQEVSFKPVLDNSLYDNAALSFVKNHWSCSADCYIKVRLKQDDNNYYEFYSLCGGSFVIKPSYLRKIVNGNAQNPASEATIIDYHNTESAILFEKKGSKIRSFAWGQVLELDDSSPLQVREWEIIVASPNVKDNSFLQSYAWATIDDLFFVKGDNIRTTIG